MLNTTEKLIIIFGSISSILLVGICVKRHIQTITQKRIDNFRQRFVKKRIKPIALMTDKELREELNEQTNNEIRTQELTNENFV